MNKDKALERLTALENEAAELRKIISQEEAYKPWRAKYGSVYWYIDYRGRLDNYTEGNHSLDDARYACGNYYPTEEIANREAEYFTTLRQLRNFSDGLDGDWVIMWNTDNSDFIVDEILLQYGIKTPRTRFATKERAEAAIKHFGDKLNLIYK